MHSLIVAATAGDVQTLTPVLAECGATVSVASEVAQAEAILSNQSVDIIFFGVRGGSSSALDWLSDQELTRAATLALIIDSEHVELAQVAQRVGVADRFCRPLNPEHVASFVSSVRGHGRDDDDDDDDVSADFPGSRLLGASSAMSSTRHLIQRVARTRASVLLIGESGTGKELAAQEVHDCSMVADGPFVPVNCGAIPAELMESELFGHVKGSFTGAHRDHRGFFEEARGGTLFLDEVTEMALPLQVKLLRALESGEYRQVGGNGVMQSDARIVASTNRRPKEAIDAGQLREDLYYRLAEFPIKIPPLRARGDDCVELAKRILAVYNAEHGTRIRFSERAIDSIMVHDWPGNVRELKNAVMRACIVAKGMIEPEDLPEADRSYPPTEAGCLRLGENATLESAERELIIATLDRCNGNKREAARALDISVRTIYNKLKQYEERNGQGAAPSPPARSVCNSGRKILL